MTESGPYIDPVQLPIATGISAEFKDLADQKFDTLLESDAYTDMSEPESDLKAILGVFEEAIGTEAGNELKAQSVAAVYAVSKYLALTQTQAEALQELGLITKHLPDTDRFNALFAISFSWLGLPHYSQELRERQVITNPAHLDRLIANEAVGHALLASQHATSGFGDLEADKSEDLLYQISSSLLWAETYKLIAELYKV